METITTRKTKAGALAYIRSQGREPGAWIPEDYWNGRETLAVETVWDVEPYDNGTHAVVSEMRLVQPADPEEPAEDVEDLFAAPPLHPVGIRQPAACERDLGKDDFNECRKPTTVYFTATEPPRPAGAGATRDWGFCSEEHARDEAEALWGCGYNFPEVGR